MPWLLLRFVRYGIGAQNGRKDLYDNGTVHVLRQEPWSGRGGGLIQIADKKFSIHSRQDKLSYRGQGLLVDGIQARVHYLGNDILKVEIAD